MSTGPDTKTQLVNAIRAYIHMDNLAETHFRQAVNARETRTIHEGEAIRLMREMGLGESTIQVTGGTTLKIQHQKIPSALTWGYLEKEIMNWATKTGSLQPDKTTQLLQWLRDHRDIKESDHLKKALVKGTETSSVPSQISNATGTTSRSSL